MTLLPTDFNIVVGMEGRAIALSVCGDLDAHAAARVVDLLLGVFEAGHRRLVVDFERIGTVDPQGLRTVEQALKRCRWRGAQAVLRFDDRRG